MVWAEGCCSLTHQPRPCHCPPVTAAAAAAKGRAYDVDERDFFWEACGAYPFPKVAEEVEVQLKAYRAAVDEINRKTNAGPQVRGGSLQATGELQLHAYAWLLPAHTGCLYGM